jgi:general secretion pathway protein L
MVLRARGLTLSDALIVRVPAGAGQGNVVDNSTTLSFLRVSRNKVVQRGRARLGDLPRTRETVLVFAAEDVLLLERVVPPLNERRLRAALPGLIEDATFVDLSSLHVAASEDANGKRLLAVIDRALLTLWLERFDENARVITHAWCEQLAMPHQIGRISASARSDAAGAVLRFANDSVLTVASPLDEALIGLALTKHPEITEAVVFGDKADGALLEALFTRLKLSARRGGSDALAEYIEADEPGEMVDLLQGEFARGMSLSGVRAWRTAVALVVLALGIETVGLLIHSAQLDHDKQHLLAEQSSILKRAFPQTTTVLDAPMQMRRALDALESHAGQTGQQDFETLLTHAGSLLANLPANSCTEMHFDENTLSMHLKAPMLASSQAQATVIKAAQALGNIATFTAAGSDGDLTMRLAPRNAP